jgi:hypothetical protein
VIWLSIEIANSKRFAAENGAEEMARWLPGLAFTGYLTTNIAFFWASIAKRDNSGRTVGVMLFAKFRAGYLNLIRFVGKNADPRAREFKERFGLKEIPTDGAKPRIR